MKLTEAATEAAARVLLRIERPSHADWDQWTEHGHDRFKAAAREILEAAAPHILKDTRPMTAVEIAARDRPESMAAARAKVREDRAAYQAEMFRAAREAAWDEGQRAWEDELLNKTPGTNPYRSQA